MSTQRPDREPGNGLHYDYRETHPAYGMIGASRVTASPGTLLAGSDFRHGRYITIRIQHAAMDRSLHADRFHSTGDPTIVEVLLSEAQWATFVSTLNVGDGVPCTIDLLDGVRQPGILLDTDRRAQLNDELRQTMAAVDERLGELEKKATTKAMRHEIGVIRSHLRENLPFVADQFDRHADKTVERMKVEVAAYITGAIQRAGLTALGAEPPIALIEAPADE